MELETSGALETGIWGTLEAKTIREILKKAVCGCGVDFEFAYWTSERLCVGLSS